MLLVQAVGREAETGGLSEASLCYTVRPCLDKTTQRKTRGTRASLQNQICSGHPKVQVSSTAFRRQQAYQTTFLDTGNSTLELPGDFPLLSHLVRSPLKLPLNTLLQAKHPTKLVLLWWGSDLILTEMVCVYNVSLPLL